MPVPPEGDLFKPERLVVVEILPTTYIDWVRGWDLASIEGDGDWTAGAKLGRLSEEQLANMRKVEADTDIGLINAGVISPAEARVRLAAQEDGPYASLDLNDEVPDPPIEQLRTAGGAELKFQQA
jgi:hypothetical protein